MGHSVCLNYFKHENPQKPVQNTPRGEITVQTNMCTSHTPNILPLPVYLTHIPKLLKSCIRNSFNPKKALLQQRQTAARFFPSTVSPSSLAMAPEITYPVYPPMAKRHSTSQERSRRVGESPP